MLSAKHSGASGYPSALPVAEVTDTALAYDRDRKGSLYARAVLEDYRVLNLGRRHLEVYRDPVPSPQARYGWGYRTVRYYTADESVAPLAVPRHRLPSLICCPDGKALSGAVAIGPTTDQD